MDHARRNLLFGRRDKPPPLRPPWSSESSILAECSGCGACMRACPSRLISLGSGSCPELDFSNAECTFCGACADACPEAVFGSRSGNAFPHVATVGDECVAHAGTECRACQDSCPETAIRFTPRLRQAAIPEIDVARCTGCGACVAPCPVEAIGLILPAREAAHV